MQVGHCLHNRPIQDHEPFNWGAWRRAQRKVYPGEIQALDARIERLRERLSAGDLDLEPDELLLAIEAAQKEREKLIDAQPPARDSAKILAALPNAAAAYKRQIEKGLKANPREANRARVIL